MRRWCTGSRSCTRRSCSTLARTTTALTEALEDQTFQDLRERVQTVLLGIAGRYGRAGADGVTIHMHLTHETIASIVGADPYPRQRVPQRTAARGVLPRG